MVAIYEYSNGLNFTGIVAETVEKAEEYLGNKYGKYEEKAVSYNEELKCWNYEKVFKPYYNKRAFEIKEITVV